MPAPQPYRDLVANYEGPVLLAQNGWDLLDTAAENAGGLPAVTGLHGTDGRAITLTYTELRDYAARFSRHLRSSCGLEPGDVVALQLANGVHFPICLFGIWRCGLVVTCINPLYTAEERRHQLRDSGAKALVLLDIGEREQIDLVGCPALAHVLWLAPDELTSVNGSRGYSLLAALRGAPDDAPPARYPVAAYQYTGGTTGRSKGAALTHLNLLSAIEMLSDFVGRFTGLQRGMNVLTPVPLYHIFALALSLLRFVRLCGHNVLVASPRPLANLAPAFRRWRFDWMFGVETLYAGLLREPWFAELAPKVGIAVTGGSAMLPATGAAWTLRVGEMMHGYGMTETSGVISFNPPGNGARAGTVGLPIPGLAVEARRQDGEPCAIDEPGELHVRGANVMVGYLHSAPTDGWFATGDIVTIDADAYICIVDRAKDMILVSGFNVYPTEIEEVIARFPGVREVAVVGRPDDRTGECVIAYLSMVDQHAISMEALHAHCARDLARYKLPQEFLLLPDLPKSAVGKILRSELRLAEGDTRFQN